jgi:hypothetical protein
MCGKLAGDDGVKQNTCDSSILGGSHWINLFFAFLCAFLLAKASERIRKVDDEIKRRQGHVITSSLLLLVLILQV